MMNKEEFAYPSADGKTQIHAVCWVPDGGIKAVLQIAHGMAEHIDRYAEFALRMNELGILVTGNDHLGHGKSVTGPEKIGYFAEKNANGTVLADLDRLKSLMKEKYPGLPYFFLGHSMGSFLCRQMIAEKGADFNGAVVMGTGDVPGYKTLAGMACCRVIAAFRGWNCRSLFVKSLAVGEYNRKFGEKFGMDWLNTRKECVDDYNRDPLCGFTFTLNAYYGMFESVHRLTDDSYVKKTPENLPVLLVSGTEDPVGDYGRAPLSVQKKLKELGVKEAELILYPGSRHEILKDIDREKVCQDIGSWILRHC